MTTTYPGVGADAAIDELHRAVGDIMSHWASIEDQLFILFVIAMTGKWLVGDIRPYRAVFFTLSAYEPKIRMINAAMNSRYRDNDSLVSEWRALKKRIDNAVNDRNYIAHLEALVKGTTDPNSPAVARLIPSFWKGMESPANEFESEGLSLQKIVARKSKWRNLHVDLQKFSLSLHPPPTQEKVP